MDNAYVLVIGIANYRHTNPLPMTVLQDAKDIAGVLLDPSQCGYLPDNVRLLLDDEATLATIEGALADLAARTNSDSTVIIYVSSHGGQIESGPRAGAYLLPVDTRYDSADEIAATAISDTAFTEALRAIPARKLVVLFDCCHAGGIGHPKTVATSSLKAGLPESLYDALKRGQGRVILASSRSTEESWILPGAVNSLFTQHLLAGLRGGIASEDGLIRIFDLFEYLQPRVTGDYAGQHPIFKAEIEENFPIALRLGGQKSPMPPSPAADGGFRYDAYVSFADREPDAGWVWKTLLPRLERAGLRVAVSNDVEEPGVARVVNVERGITQAKRTVTVLSDAYLADNMADFENTLAQTMGIEEGRYRLLPLKMAPFDESRLPMRLKMLSTVDLAHPYRAEREVERLVQALRGPLPRR
jgi:hypothetical protein